MALKANLLYDPSLIDSARTTFDVDGTITYSGSYPNNGDTLDFSQLGIPSNAVPVWCDIDEYTPAGQAAYGANFLFLPGTLQNNGVVQIFNGTAQIGANTYATIFGAIPVALRFNARFQCFV